MMATKVRSTAVRMLPYLLFCFAACRTGFGSGPGDTVRVTGTTPLPVAGFEIAGRVVGAEGQGVVVVQVKAWPLGSVPADSSARLLAHDVGALLGHGAAGLVANSAGSLVATERNTTSLVGLTDGKGQFRLRLPEGRYNLEAVRSSAQKGWLHDVVVGGPEAASADLTLKITPTASLRGRMLVGTMPGQVPDLTKVEVLVA